MSRDNNTHSDMNGENNVGSLSERLLKGMSEGLVCLAISMGFNTGLLHVMLRNDAPISVESLAEEASCKPRYVEEWLGVLTSAGVVFVDSTSQLYRLNPQYKAELGEVPERNETLALTRLFQGSMAALTLVQDAFKQHGPLGTSYADYPDFSNLMDGYSKTVYTEEHVRKIVDHVPALKYKLEAGISVCELGAGRGQQAKVMARVWPKSHFLASDISEEAIHKGQQRAEKEKISNLRWKVLDACSLPNSMDDSFDIVYICDALHDMPHASQALKCCHRVLKSDGQLVLLETNMESGHHRNMGPMNTFNYGMSMLHCLPVSLGVPGSEGLGCAWGKDKMRLYCAQAGFKVLHCKVIDDYTVILICVK